jgi:hypothetical protein
MSAAEKYARPVESMPAEALSQARAAGQVLADKGVTHSAAASQTPAAKYAPPTNSQLERSLSQGQSR